MAAEYLELTGLPSAEEVEAELRLRSLVDFIPAMSPRYMPPRHLAPLLKRFELAVEGVPQRVCCSAPPRHAKTESVLHVPAFALRRRPELVFGYTTYGASLSHSKSKKARALVQAAGVTLERDATHEWRTPEGGGMLAGGVGGPLTGHGLDILIVDDPTKNRLEAESATYRERLVDWFRDVATTRVEPNGSRFVFATRWTPEDLIGQLVDNEGWDYINLPALSEDGTPLWPERWSAEELQAKRRDVGEYTWASLYQGQPRPRGGRVFNDVHTYSALPTVYTKALGIDVAYSAKTSADRSVAVVMMRGPKHWYLVDVVVEQVPPAVFKRRLAVLHRTHRNAPVHWYAAGTELGAAAFLREAPDAVPVTVTTARADKFTRAIGYAAAWNRGEVLVPEEAPWLSRVVAEHASFTGVDGGADDIIDACVAAFDALPAEAEEVKTRVPRVAARGLMAERM